MANLALGSAFEGRGRSSFLLLDLPLRHCQRLLATLIAIQPWFRFRSPKKWMAELEIVVVVLNLLFGFAFIRHFDLHLHAHLSLPISREQISAISIVSGVLLFVIRGGTYIVRGCLRKTETLPQLSLRGTEADSDTGNEGI